MKHLTSTVALAAALLLGSAAAQAQTTFFSFQGLLEDGPLAGQTFSGSFSVNASALPPGGDASFPLLSFSMLLGSISYTLATADVTPTAVYAQGSFAGLSYVDIDAPDPALRPRLSFVPGFDDFGQAYVAYQSLLSGPVTSGFGSYSVTVVPEPASLALMLAGLGAVGAAARRRAAAKA